MKEILIITFILLNFVFTFAQNQTSTDWQKFAPDGEEFVVEVPKTMVESVNFRQLDEEKHAFVSADYRKYFNGVYYFIFSSKLTPNSISTTSYLYEPLKSFVNEFDKESETIKFGDFSGNKYEFKDSEDFYHTIIFVKTNNRAYRFHTIQEESVSGDARRFLNSIHLFREVLKPKIYEEKLKIINLDELSNYNLSSKKKTNQNQPVIENSADVTPLKMTSKPRASYTDVARFYEIKGSVVLTAEFLPSGEIGKIVPTERLPFGLTQSVMNAVRKIKFEPAKKNGEAFTVTKQLIYSFTIY